MRYVSARLFSDMETRAYRLYIGDAMMTAANNTARFAGGMTIKHRLIDVIGYKREKPKADKSRTEAEIIGTIIRNAGLGVKIS